MDSTRWHRSGWERCHGGGCGFFGNLGDPRTDNAKLHSFNEVLVIALCTVVCGGETCADMGGRAQCHPWLTGASAEKSACEQAANVLGGLNRKTGLIPEGSQLVVELVGDFAAPGALTDWTPKRRGPAAMVKVVAGELHHLY
jgi:hypothetical protein